jgi:AraC-like DNA-binding protein
MASLIPYFDMQEAFPEQIAALKIIEAITILRTINPDLDPILANFETPDRIDLPQFMEKNFMFNMPLERFGYLTGRSLTTFKRDFFKAFNTTPQRWLTQKRLELACYQLLELNRKPVEVCYETGFESLSHFSYAFKKHFGSAPTEFIKQKGGRY